MAIELPTTPSTRPWTNEADKLETIIDAAQEALKMWHERTDDREMLRGLLRRAAGKLQDYCAEANGDLNDNLATEIYAVLGD